MNRRIETRFMKKIKPVILKLAKGWFPPDKKTPDGEHYYACTWCDQNCGKHDKHDDDCLYQIAKNTVEEWDRIEKSKEWDRTWNKKPRPEKEIRFFKDWNKYRAVWNLFIKEGGSWVPLDYSDPDNKSIVCTCHVFKRSARHQHQKDCPIIKVAAALHEVYKPTGPEFGRKK